jgi:hypothetical protein
MFTTSFNYKSLVQINWSYEIYVAIPNSNQNNLTGIVLDITINKPFNMLILRKLK